MRQGYNIVWGVTMAGRILPPLVGIKSTSKQAVEPGHPLIIKVTDPEYASMFDSGDVVPALIVVYAPGDKKILGEIYMSEILNKLCELRKSKLRCVSS